MREKKLEMSHFVLWGWLINMARDNSWAPTSPGHERCLNAFQGHVALLSQSLRCEDLMPNSGALSLPLTATLIFYQVELCLAIQMGGRTPSIRGLQTP